MYQGEGVDGNLVLPRIIRIFLIGLQENTILDTAQEKASSDTFLVLIPEERRTYQRRDFFKSRWIYALFSKAGVEELTPATGYDPLQLGFAFFAAFTTADVGGNYSSDTVTRSHDIRVIGNVGFTGFDVLGGEPLNVVLGASDVLNRGIVLHAVQSSFPGGFGNKIIVFPDRRMNSLQDLSFGSAQNYVARGITASKHHLQRRRNSSC